MGVCIVEIGESTVKQQGQQQGLKHCEIVRLRPPIVALKMRATMVRIRPAPPPVATAPPSIYPGKHPKAKTLFNKR